jgi:chloride channel protein, CIC family
MKKKIYPLIDAVVLGIAGAFGARLFNYLLKTVQNFSLGYLAGYMPPKLAIAGGNLVGSIGKHGLIFIPIVLIAGGIISGFLIYSLAPEAEGLGTNTVISAFHLSDGKIRTIVAPLKIIASAVTLGTGGSAGKEGPTTLFSAGIGSIYATVTKRPESYRRTLVLMVVAAGLSAIFRAPIGTAIFAIEVLYRDMDFEASGLIYIMIASITAYVINGIFVGWKPLFQIPDNLGINKFNDYLLFILLGIASGIFGTLLPSTFYKIRDIFHKVPINPHFKPAIGAAGVGLIALAYPQVLGGGYGWIQNAIDGRLAASLLIILLFLKLISLSLTVSSGGSGGVFAPTLYMGAMLGGFLGIVFHQSTAAFAIVGMASVFGSAGRVPIAALFMVTEMTGSYTLLVPTALSVALAFFVQDKLSIKLKYKTLYESQIKDSAESPAHLVEDLRTSIKLLSEKRSFKGLNISHLNFILLLQLGIPLKIPNNKKLFLGTLTKNNPCIGTAIKDNCLNSRSKDWQIAGILRRDHLVIPNPNTILEENDQMIIFGVPNVIEKLNGMLKLPNK